MKLSPAMLGLVRGLGYPILMLVLAYFGDVNHLSPFLSLSSATIIAALLSSLDHYIESVNGNALFGAFRTN